MFKYFVAMCDIKFVLTSNISFWVVSYTYTLKDHHTHGYMKYSFHKVTLTAKKLDSTRRLSELIHIREQVHFHDDIKFSTYAQEKKIPLIMPYAVNTSD